MKRLLAASVLVFTVGCNERPATQLLVHLRSSIPESDMAEIASEVWVGGEWRGRDQFDRRREGGLPQSFAVAARGAEESSEIKISVTGSREEHRFSRLVRGFVQNEVAHVYMCLAYPCTDGPHASACNSTIQVDALPLRDEPPEEWSSCETLEPSDGGVGPDEPARADGSVAPDTGPRDGGPVPSESDAEVRPPRVERVISIGGAGKDQLDDVAIDSQGNTTVLLQFRDTLSFGGVTYASPGFNALVVRLDPSGRPLERIHHLKSGGELMLADVVVDDLGRAYVSGRYTGTLRANDTVLKGNPGDPGENDGFVLRIDPANASSPYAVQTFGGPSGDDHAYGLAIDLQNRKLALTGTNTDPFTLGPCQLSVADVADEASAFVMIMNLETLACEEAIGIQGSVNVTAYAVAFDPGEPALVAGGFLEANAIIPGPPPVSLSVPSGRSTEAFVARFRLNPLAVVNAIVLGGVQRDLIETLAVAPDGTVIAAGSFESSVDFQVGGASQSVASGEHIYAVLLNRDLSVLSTAKFQGATGSSVDIHGSLWLDERALLGGAFVGLVNFPLGLGGTIAYPSAGAQDGMILSVARDGSFVAGLKFGGMGAERVKDLQMGGTQLIAVGTFSGQFSLPIDEVTSAGDDDGLVCWIVDPP